MHSKVKNISSLIYITTRSAARKTKSASKRVIPKRAYKVHSAKDITRDDVQPALNYIQDYWSQLTRSTKRQKDSYINHTSTLIPLKNPYIVPSNESGGFVFEEQYYWDSFFTAIGMDDKKMIVGMLENLIQLYSEFGLIPNANRYYFTSRSQPPILTTFIFYVYERFEMSDKWLQKNIAVAKDEYQHVWMSTKHPHHRQVHKGLSRYYDINSLHDLAEAESGWDMTPRFQRQCLDYVPIDLNCLLHVYEQDFARAARLAGDDDEATRWDTCAATRREQINSTLWNQRQGFYFDYNYHEDKKSPVWSLAAYYALWSGVATDKQAEKLVETLPRFKKPGGLTTTIGNMMLTKLFGSTKTQWAYPNGWAPLHYITIKGLQRYGYEKEAKELARTWIANCNSWFVRHGEFLEKYNVVEPQKKPVAGVYPSQSGFGWTNGVFTALSREFLEDNSGET